MAKEAFDMFMLCLRMVQSSVAVILNVLTLICVVKSRSLHNPAGVLVACLAITDTLHGLIIYTLPIRNQVSSICASSLAAETFTFCAQIMTFVVIAMERRNCLLAQLSLSIKWQVKKVSLCLIGSWVAIASFFVAFAVGTPRIPIDIPCTHINTFHNGFYYTSVVFCTLCTLAIIGCYASIAKIIRSSSQQVALNATEQQRRQQKAAMRITKMMALVVGIFFVLYIPVTISFIFMTESPPFWHYVIHQITISMPDVNFWINPAIYAWRNKQFRKAFLQLFACCWQHCRRQNNLVEPVNGIPPHVNIQTIDVGSREPMPSTSRNLEPRREFTVGLSEPQGTSNTLFLPTVET